MVMRIGGLASGMDIDSIVEKLMQAERAPLDKLQQKKQTYEWQRDAYRNVNTKIKTLDTYIADNLVLKTLNAKTVSSSNSNLVSATATGTATGTLSIEGVSQLATTARAVGDQVNATGSTKMSSLIGTGTKTIELGAIQANGTMPSALTKIEITDNMTVSQFITKVNESNAGINAIFENGRFSFTAKNSGDNKAGDEIEMSEASKGIFYNLGFYRKNEADNKYSYDADKKFQTTDGKNAVFQVNGIATERSTNTFALNGYNITLNQTFNEATTNTANNEAIRVNLDNATKNLDDLLTSLSGTYNVNLSSLNGLDKKVEAVKAEITAKITEYENSLETANKDLNAASNQFLTDANLDAESKAFLSSLSKEQREALANKDLLTIDLQTTDWTDEQKILFNKISDKTAVANLSEQSLKRTAGSVYDSLSEDAKNYLANNTGFADLTSSGLSDEEKAILTAHGTDLKAIPTNKDAVSLASVNLANVNNDANNLLNTTDAYNNAVNASNNSTAAVTQNVQAPVTLTATTNVDEMMNKVKEFVTTYNGFIKELNDMTKETKYRDYQPLTSEQKKEMEKDEIELWEQKAKSGLLKNDSIIREGLSNMRSLIYQSNPAIADTRYNTLFSIGITTSKSYNDGGTLEIDEDKLRKAIEENPDAVEQLLKNTSGKKDEIIQVTKKDESGKEYKATEKVDTRGYLVKLREAMKSVEVNIEKRAGRSSWTDAQYVLGKNLIDVGKRLDTWEDKLKSIEDRYWKQFTAMETAINNANQQSSLFTQG